MGRLWGWSLLVDHRPNRPKPRPPTDFTSLASDSILSNILSCCCDVYELLLRVFCCVLCLHGATNRKANGSPQQAQLATVKRKTKPEQKQNKTQFNGKEREKRVRKIIKHKRQQGEDSHHAALVLAFVPPESPSLFLPVCCPLGGALGAHSVWSAV